MSEAARQPQRRLCRDCLALQIPASPTPARCRDCGSPRLVGDAERRDLAIAHVDCDAFYASVEKRDDPALRDKPLIIGGGLRRGVVSTCCYIARTCGVRSAMPMAQALKLCPEAAVLAPDMRKYAAVGQDIRERMRALTPLVEPLSIDEAFLDLAGCEGANGGGAIPTLARLARRIEIEVGVTVSVGLSDCKFLAKLASDMQKPRGFSVIGREEASRLLAPMPVGRIWGVGKVAEARLEKAGLKTIGDVQARGERAMMAAHGEEGRRLWRLANGVDARRVSIERETKSVSAEVTFDDDVADPERLAAALLGLCERVARRLKGEGLAAKSVTLKLRAGDFKLRTRSRSGQRPTQLATRLFAVSRELLSSEATGGAFRLIGVAAGDFSPGELADQSDLAEDLAKDRARESAIDALRDKFGRGAIQRGLAFKASPKRGGG